MSTITESIGRVLAGRYRIESALGSGASANVFAAFDTTLQRRVAVKVLHPALAADGGFLRRFRAEAQSAAALADAHVLAVHDWGEDAQGPFLVLEFLGGGSLRDMLDEGTLLTLAQAVSVGAQAAEGLAYAHARGFVHRDVKPANLLFDEEGRLRVADFGLARALAEASMTEPAGTTVGTARYAAPEQALGNRVDGRADVYSLALVLYEAVTGVVPFTADTTISTLMARVGAELPGHDGLGPLAEVLSDAATPDAEDRLDATAFAARLNELAEDLPAPAKLRLAGAGGAGVVLPRPVTPPADRDLTDHGMVLPPPPTGRRSRGGEDPDVLAFAAAVGLTNEAAAAVRRRRRRWPWVVAIVVLLAALAGGGATLALKKAKIILAVTPTYKLPAITGLTVAQAQTKLNHDRFQVRVGGHDTSITVPAGEILTQAPPAGEKLKRGSPVSVVVSSGLPTVAIPALTTVAGDCPAITALLLQSHFKTACTDPNSTTVPKGTVITWSPMGSAPYGSTITVTVSAGPPTETIPSLTGQSCAGATTTLKAVGLQANCANQYSSSVPSGEVIAWNPTGSALEGATVNIAISLGPQPVVIPGNLYQDTVSEAVGALQALGLTPVSGGGSLAGHVFLSSPPAGSSVLPGTTVTLYSH
jgi:beta-lactam-binding protein with PASTA domain/tRNA A-37 threonylcarbamoyl transferase component Bud32